MFFVINISSIELFLKRNYGARRTTARGGKAVRDPVCGMDIVPTQAAARSEYAGKIYYFCARVCKELFDKDPERYLTPQPFPQHARALYEALTILGKAFYAPTSSELTDVEWFALRTLGRQGESMMRALAEECAVALSTMTGVVDRLVKKGLVQRRHSEEDRRVVLVSLTRQGEITYQKRLDADMRLILTMLKALDPAEQVQLVAMMEKIVHSLPAGFPGGS
ncbi:MAG: YHS domain-containing protein [Nitrospinota bacterium]|nr:MAG: YHS domain-containing protein [Nitrospinota bacterium]